MHIDFSPVMTRDESLQLYAFSKNFSLDDLKQATHDVTEALKNLVHDLDDDEINSIPRDYDAATDDNPAPEGWSVGHLIAHITATSEEAASFSSILARGIAGNGRLRFEADWQTQCRTLHAVIQRLEESQRMQLAYLDTWPDNPHLNIFWGFPEHITIFYRQINAQSAIVLGLSHAVGHFEQIKETIRQAKANITSKA